METQSSINIVLTEENVIKKRYKIRRTGNRNATIETSIPKEAFEREARRLGLTVEEAFDKLEAVWRFNSFPGLHLSFEQKRKPLNVNPQQTRLAHE